MTANLMELSNAQWADACSGRLSERGTRDALFEAAYLALLETLTVERRQRAEHPSAELVREGCANLDIPSAVGERYAELKYSARNDALPSKAALMLWGEQVRRRIQLRNAGPAS